MAVVGKVGWAGLDNNAGLMAWRHFLSLPGQWVGFEKWWPSVLSVLKKNSASICTILVAREQKEAKKLLKKTPGCDINYPRQYKFVSSSLKLTANVTFTAAIQILTTKYCIVRFVHVGVHFTQFWNQA